MLAPGNAHRRGLLVAAGARVAVAAVAGALALFSPTPPSHPVDTPAAAPRTSAPTTTMTTTTTTPVAVVPVDHPVADTANATNAGPSAAPPPATQQQQDPPGQAHGHGKKPKNPKNPKAKN